MQPDVSGLDVGPVEVTVLGGLGVALPGPRQVHLPTRALALVALLAAHAGSPQPRSYLAGLLWPESSESQARTNLRREVHQIRSVLGEGCGLSIDGAQLLWRPTAGCVVDVVEFATAGSRAMAAVAAGDGDAVRRDAAAAMAAYRGLFLPGLPDEWVSGERDALNRHAVELCDAVGEFWASRDDPATAAPYARRRIQLEPLEEIGYTRLMLLQRDLGDRAGAVTTYHQSASTLERELGVEPGPELRRALREVMADSAPVSDESGSALAGSVLVGRAGELAALLSTWRSAATRAGMVLITGEPGVGKSRLMSELEARVTGGDVVVVRARCYEATDGIPLAPVAQWLRSPALRHAVHRLDPAWRIEVERLLPSGDATPVAGSSATARVDAWQRHRFFEGLALAVTAVRRPLLLTLDDLQWSDRATLAWLSFLLAHPPQTPMLVVATARAEELRSGPLADPVRALRAGVGVQVVRVDELDDAATLQLAEQTVGRPVQASELRLLGSIAGGNPLYLVESIRASLASPGPLAPSDVRGVLRERLDRLPEPVRRTAGLAAAVGRDFGLDLLTEAADVPADQVVAHVDYLWRQRILVQDGFTYTFAHDLLRDAAYESTTPGLRWLLHRRLAQALELRSRDDPAVDAEIARQYARGGQPERSLPFFEQAARQASAVFAHDEAVRLWDEGLAVLAGLPQHRGRDERELAMLLGKLPPLNAFRGYTAPEMEPAALRVADLAKRLGHDSARGNALLTLWATVHVQGRVDESFDLATEILAGSVSGVETAAEGHMAYAGSALARGMVDEAGQHFALACRLAGHSDSLPIGTRTAVHARAWWAHAQWLSGDAAGATATAGKAVGLARDIEHPYSLSVALAYAAVTAQLTDDTRALGDLLDELTELCSRYRFAYYSEWARVLSGWLDGGPEGLATASTGIQTLTADNALVRMPYWLSLVANVHHRSGDMVSAQATLESARSYAGRHGDAWWLPEVLRRLARLGPPADAPALLDRAAGLATVHGSTALLRRCLDDQDAVRRARPPG